MASRLDFAEHRPGPPLDGFVESLWLTLSSRPLYRRLAVFPDGSAVAMLNLGRRQGVLDGRGGVAWVTDAWVCGPRTRPLTVVAGEDHRLLGIRFRPGGAAPFFGVPVDALTDQVVALDELWPGGVEEVRERVAEAAVTTTATAATADAAAAAAFAVVERTLVARAGDGLAPVRLVDEALRRLRRAEEPVRMARLAADLGVTSRHLARLFGRSVGLSPKLAERIFRFGRALEPGGHRSFTELAHHLGYYDQAHFTHDFRRFAGMTPSAYARSRAMGAMAEMAASDGPTELVLTG